MEWSTCLPPPKILPGCQTGDVTEEDALQLVTPARLFASLLYSRQLAAFTVQLSYVQQWSELVWKLSPPLKEGS